MTRYELLLYLHILGAVVWVGVVIFFQYLVFHAERTGDYGVLWGLLRDIEWLTNRLFIPATLLVLVSGILMVVDGPWSFSQLWIVIGLSAFAVTFALGKGVIEPVGKKVDVLVDEHGPDHPATRRQLQAMFLLMRVDVALLVLIVADMASKPTADDVWTLAVGAAILAATAVYVALRFRSLQAGAPEAALALAE